MPHGLRIKSMFRHNFVCALLLCMVLLFTACSAKKDGQQPSSPAPSESSAISSSSENSAVDKPDSSAIEPNEPDSAPQSSAPAAGSQSAPADFPTTNPFPDGFLPYDPWGTEIVSLTLQQVQAVPAGATYRQVLQLLGPTRDVSNELSSSATLCYRVDGDLLLLRVTDLDAVWPQAGAVTKADLIPAAYTEALPENVYYAVVLSTTVSDDSVAAIMAYAPSEKKFDTIHIRMDAGTSIQHADGQAADTAELTFGNRILVELRPEIAESYPPQAQAVRFTLL